LKAVHVDDGAEIVELVMPGGHRCFPDAAFLLLAVAHDDVNTRGRAAKFERERITHGGAQALPERATGNLDAGNFQPVRMAFERRAELA
jgi:hypothetical protein